MRTNTEPFAMLRSHESSRDLTVRSYHVRASTVDEKARTVEAVMASEEPVRVFDMRAWEPIREILVMSGLRMPTQVPLLDSHQRNSIQQQLGSTRNIRIEGSQLIGTRFLSSVSAGVDAFTKIREGHLTDGSIGYQVLGFTDLEPGGTFQFQDRAFRNDGQDRLRVTYDWAVMEDSLCPIGADPTAKMREAAPTLTHHRASAPIYQEQSMTFEQWLKARGFDATALSETQRSSLRALFDGEQARSATPTGTPAAPAVPATTPAPTAAHNEREQVEAMKFARTIVGAAREFGLEAEIYLDRSKYPTLEDAMSDMLKARAKAQEPKNPEGSAVRIDVTADGQEKVREAVIDALVNSGGGKTEKDLGLRRHRPTELVRKWAGMFDQRAHYLVADDMAKLASRQNLDSLQLRDANQIAATFTNVLAAASGKLVLQGYQNTRVTNKLWVRPRFVTDFKPVLGVGVIQSLLKEQEGKGAPMREALLKEASYTGSLGLFGRTVRFTYQDWRNDDLGELLETVRQYGVLAGATEDQQTYKLLLGATWTGRTTSSAKFWDDTNQRVILNPGLAAVRGALESRTVTVGSESVPIEPVLKYLIVSPYRRDAAYNAMGLRQSILNAQLDSDVVVISTQWLANASLPGYSQDNYYLVAGNGDSVVMLRDQFNPEPNIQSVDPGFSPDVCFLVTHAFRPILANQDLTQQGVW